VLCPLPNGYWLLVIGNIIMQAACAIIVLLSFPLCCICFLLFAIRFSFHRKRFRGVPMSAFDFGRRQLLAVHLLFFLSIFVTAITFVSVHYQNSTVLLTNSSRSFPLTLSNSLVLSFYIFTAT